MEVYTYAVPAEEELDASDAKLDVRTFLLGVFFASVLLILYACVESGVPQIYRA